MSRLAPHRVFLTVLGSLLISVTCLGHAPQIASAQPQQPGAGAATEPSPRAANVSGRPGMRSTWARRKSARSTPCWTSSTNRADRCVRGNSASKIEISRFGQKAVLETTMDSLETSQGEVLSFRVETRAGPSPVIVQGVSRDNVMQLTTTSQGKQTTSQLPWQKSYGGFFALDQSLMRSPMKQGEKRDLTTLMPGVAGVQLVKSHLEAQQIESVELLDGQKQQLMRITMTNLIGAATRLGLLD